MGAGLRRIEGLTGRGAQQFVQMRLKKLQNAAAYLKAAPDEIDRKVLEVMEQAQAIEKELAKARREAAKRDIEVAVERRGRMCPACRCWRRKSMHSIPRCCAR